MLSGDAEFPGFRFTQCQPKSRPTEVRTKFAIHRHWSTLEQQLFNPGMIMKVFDVPQRFDGTPQMRMHRRSGMCRERQRLRNAKRGGLKKTGDATATGDIGLQYIDRTRLQ